MGGRSVFELMELGMLIGMLYPEEEANVKNIGERRKCLRLGGRKKT